MYSAKGNGCPYSVRCMLQCSTVVITLLDVHCSALCFSLLCWIYGSLCDMVVIFMWDAYCNVPW